MSQGDKNELAAYLDDLRRLWKVHVANTIEGRRKQSANSRRLFRLFGFLVVLLSVTMPFISSLPIESLPQKDIIQSVISLIIAAFTSVISFFAWRESWHLHSKAHYLLVRFSALWELKIVEASHMDNLASAKKYAYEATRELLENTSKLMESSLAENLKVTGPDR